MLSVPSSIYEVVAVGMWVVHLEDAIMAPGSLTQSHGHRPVSDAKRAGEGGGVTSRWRCAPSTE